MKGKKYFRWADFITTLRIILGIIFVMVLMYFPNKLNIWLSIIIISIIFAMDGLDGIFARHFDKPSKTGGFYDIVGDRIIEIILQIPFVYLRILNPVVLLYYVVKDFVVDYIRTANLVHTMTTKAPFDQLKRKVSIFLIKSRFMRFSYALAKMLMFIFLIIALYNSSWISFANYFAYFTVFLSLLRSIPVVIEYLI